MITAIVTLSIVTLLLAVVLSFTVLRALNRFITTQEHLVDAVVATRSVPGAQLLHAMRGGAEGVEEPPVYDPPEADTPRNY